MNTNNDVDCCDTPVFLINMSQETARLSRMKLRLAYHGLLEHLHIIDAAGIKHPTTDFANFIEQVPLDESPLLYAANLFSHLLALRQLVNQTNAEAGLILEDDVMLKHDFQTHFREKVGARPGHCRLILFSPYITKPLLDWEDIALGNGLFEIQPFVASAACYWITRTYAEECLFLFDRPMREYPRSRQKAFGSEPFIIQQSLGCMVWPPLAIEDAIDSSLQTRGHTIDKRKYWEAAAAGYENFECPGEDVRSLW